MEDAQSIGTSRWASSLSMRALFGPDGIDITIQCMDRALQSAASVQQHSLGWLVLGLTLQLLGHLFKVGVF